MLPRQLKRIHADAERVSEMFADIIERATRAKEIFDAAAQTAASVQNDLVQDGKCEYTLVACLDGSKEMYDAFASVRDMVHGFTESTNEAISTAAFASRRCDAMGAEAERALDVLRAAEPAEAEDDMFGEEQSDDVAEEGEEPEVVVVEPAAKRARCD